MLFSQIQRTGGFTFAAAMLGGVCYDVYANLLTLRTLDAQRARSNTWETVLRTWLHILLFSLSRFKPGAKTPVIPARCEHVGSRKFAVQFDFPWPNVEEHRIYGFILYVNLIHYLTFHSFTGAKATACATSLCGFLASGKFHPLGVMIWNRLGEIRPHLSLLYTDYAVRVRMWGL